jgi:hypothetical protein
MFKHPKHFNKEFPSKNTKKLLKNAQTLNKKKLDGEVTAQKNSAFSMHLSMLPQQSF